ncbi:MAG: anaerobic ribonucleoside-triphosphate reductase activating protein [Candidatus Bathyarchaeia archaeon]
MKFSGFQKASLIDFPRRISSILFAPGCNLRCPYCQNWRIVIDTTPSFLDEDEALAILEVRKKFIDSVVISGGEPLIQRDAPRFIRKLKERGFIVKLDTNGFFPERLKECLPYLDYVAVDIKTSPRKYYLLGAENVEPFLETIKIVMNSDVDYEYRCTIVPSIVEREDMEEIGNLVEGARRFALQQFIPDNAMQEDFRKIRPYSESTIKQFSKIMEKYVKEVILRI